MQERVTPHGDDFAEVVVQWNNDLMSVGLGLEPRSVVPGLHFVDAIYGGVPSQTQIGKIFFEKRRQDFEEHMDFATSDAEAEFYNQLGRDILDAVTGSSTTDGIWTWLERSGTNRLIRLLRKARDASFGRDE
jgi:hypothetical protein